jgi:hypothetical protein
MVCSITVRQKKTAGRALVIGKDRNLFADTVNVGCIAERQAAVVDADLHPADIVAHDEKNVGLWRRCLLPRGAQNRGRGQQKPGDYRATPHHLRYRCFICHLLVDELDDYSPARAETEVIVVEAKSAVYSLLAKMPTM